jgi:hypothetical protein
MFDDKPFPKSKLYFNMLQLTRLFIGCIEETIRDLHIARDRFMSNRTFELRKSDHNFKNDLEKLSIEWTKRIESREPKLQVLVDRLRRKKEEIESLRDGVSTLVNRLGRDDEKSRSHTQLALQRHIGT